MIRIWKIRIYIDFIDLDFSDRNIGIGFEFSWDDTEIWKPRLTLNW